MAFLQYIFGPGKSSGSSRKHKTSDASVHLDLIPKLEPIDESSGFGVPIQRRRKYNAELLLRMALIFTTILSFLLLIAYFNKHPTDKYCKRQISTWSPALDAVEFERVDFLNKPGQPSAYRGKPTHKLEAAWEKLWFYGTVPIHENRMNLINRTADPKWSANPDGSGYRALIEVFHQLHCLDIIRQYTWREYYAKHTESVSVPFLLTPDNEVVARMHTDHCIEALRLSLMCHGDTTPYLLEIDPKSPSGFSPDFSMHHKCVRFEPLVEYMGKQKYQVESHNPH